MVNHILINSFHEHYIWLFIGHDFLVPNLLQISKLCVIQLLNELPDLFQNNLKDLELSFATDLDF